MRLTSTGRWLLNIALAVITFTIAIHLVAPWVTIPDTVFAAMFLRLGVYLVLVELVDR